MDESESNEIIFVVKSILLNKVLTSQMLLILSLDRKNVNLPEEGTWIVIQQIEHKGIV